MTQFDEMMRTQYGVQRAERISVQNGLTRVLDILRHPSDSPELDKAEIRTRVIAAKEHLRLYG